MKRTVLALAASLVLLARPALADPSAFDLAGPSLRISVTRQGVTLPIGQVPQLSTGDRIRLETELPPDEAAHYLLVAALLREPTNPPPDKWFWKSASWKPAGRGGGPIELTVPAGAQHLVLFLAPATGGDFTTLRDAVKARPGAFVRAAQDLEQASLDHSRYGAYLAAIRKVAATAPEQLAHVSPIIAGSLHIKINEDCLQRQPDLQAACLLDAKQATVLGNGDSTAVSPLSAAATDFALNLSATPAGGLGYYSPYISTIRDIFAIFGAMHTAKYQYIPALSVPNVDGVALVLNMPPSFADPKSVLMAALPGVQAANVPTVAVAANPAPGCLGADEAALPLTVGPLFYATGYAGHMALRVSMPGQAPFELPVVADAARGGLVIAASSPPSAIRLPAGTGSVSATLRGMWGFEPFAAPAIKLETAGDWHWQAATAGKDKGQLLLSGDAAACVSSVTVTTAEGSAQPASWKAIDPRQIGVMLPAADEGTAPVVLTIAGPSGTAAARLVITPPPKPAPAAAAVVAHSSEAPSANGMFPIAIVLDSPDEIPGNARLNFTLKSEAKGAFDGRESVEIGTAQGGDTAKLTIGSGLTRVDPGVLVGSLVPAQALGKSAFGPLRVRLVRGGVAGDWLNLGNLVRLPSLAKLTCPASTTASCTLTGEELYLLASVASNPDFEDAASVPEGYPGFTLPVPHLAKGGVLFVRLHDAPEVVNHLLATQPPEKPGR